MKKYKRVYVAPEVHKRAKEIAAREGITIADAIAEALGKNADNELRINKNYGLFK